MKSKIVVLFFLVTSVFYGQNQTVIAVLFDNSGSMTQKFSREDLKSAEKAVKDLIFSGTFEDKWSLVGSPLENPLWSASCALYVHAFGEFDRKLIFPDSKRFFQSYENPQEAMSDLETFFQSSLDYRDHFTNIDLAKKYAWHSIFKKSNEGINQIHILLVTDDIPDISHNGKIIKNQYEDPYIEAGGTEKDHFKLTLKDKAYPLKIFYKTLSYEKKEEIAVLDEPIVAEEEIDIFMEEDTRETQFPLWILYVIAAAFVFIFIIQWLRKKKFFRVKNNKTEEDFKDIY